MADWVCMKNGEPIPKDKGSYGMKRYQYLFIICHVVFVSIIVLNSNTHADSSKELKKVRKKADEAAETLNSIGNVAKEAGNAFRNFKSMFNPNTGNNNDDDAEDDDDDEIDDDPAESVEQEKSFQRERQPKYYRHDGNGGEVYHKLKSAGNREKSRSKTSSFPATVNADILNLRRAPTTTGNIIDKLYHGQTVEVIREHKGWARIRTQNRLIGWVASRYLSRYAGHVNGQNTRQKIGAQSRQAHHNDMGMRSGNQHRNIEYRLRELNSLYGKGLITQQEYARKKAEILRDL